jgi:hypothetical protein
MSFLPLVVLTGKAQVVPMFSDHCPRHGRRVLLGPEAITAVRQGPDGVRLEWRCPCGGRGSYAPARRRRSAPIS